MANSLFLEREKCMNSFTFIWIGKVRLQIRQDKHKLAKRIAEVTDIIFKEERLKEKKE